ncbi:hypothetical protein [Metabacillus fastidiosus]|uniref:hypothetical protein n=1 Tax=Metabacillus fastidiosus TaxID=1458 RepID=UPI003D27B5F3
MTRYKIKMFHAENKEFKYYLDTEGTLLEENKGTGEFKRLMDNVDDNGTVTGTNWQVVEVKK